jgi:hypothetical protein
MRDEPIKEGGHKMQEGNTTNGTDQSGEGKLDARLTNQGKEPYIERHGSIEEGNNRCGTDQSGEGYTR